MARPVTRVRVFVASPSDLEEERKALGDAVAELNRTVCRYRDIYLELVTWETHVRPGIGEDAQAVINDQIQDDYDIFVGLLWSRFGTPTKRAGSGTEEEFDRAYSRFAQDKASLRIIVYRKNEPVSPSNIDPNQLASIRAFEEKLSEAGTLWKVFETCEEFKQIVRIHLAELIHEFNTTWGRVDTSASTPLRQSAAEYSTSSSISNAECDDDEPGFLDLLIEAQNHMERFSDAANGIGSELNSLALDISRSDKKLKGIGKFDPKSARAAINELAADMENFLSRVRPNAESLGEHVEGACSCFTEAISLARTLITEDDLEGISGTIEIICRMREATTYARTMLADLTSTVIDLPRATSTFNRAKRSFVSMTKMLDTEMMTSNRLFGELERVLRELLESHTTPRAT